MAMGIRTPGPIHHFVRFRSSQTAFYLGTAVAAPEPENEKFKLEVMNDLSGRSVPFQLVKDGEKWLIMTVLNRFDYSIVQTIRALDSGQTPITIPPVLGAGAGAGAALGSENGVARGSLVLGISDFQLITTNQYFGTISAGSFIGVSDLAPGRIFFSCNLRKYKESTQGTRVLEVAMAIEALGMFNLTTRGFNTYSESAGDFGTIAAIS